MQTIRISRILALIMLAILAAPGANGAEVAGGNEGGGGGGAYVCRDPATNAVSSVELLDLFETRSTGNQIAFDDSRSVDEQVEAAIVKLRKIDSLLGDETLANWKYIKNHKIFGPSDLEIEVDDVDPHFKKEGCKLEGMMYYSDLRKRLVIKQEIFNLQKRPTEYAASYVHEALYKVMRDVYGENRSTIARQITGCLFSTDVAACLNLKPIQFPRNAVVWKCADSINAYYVYPTGRTTTLDGGTGPETGPEYKVIFTKLGGATFGYETSVLAVGFGGTVAASIASGLGPQFPADDLVISGLEFLPLKPLLTDSDLLYDTNLELSRFTRRLCKIVQH